MTTRHKILMIVIAIALMLTGQGAIVGLAGDAAPGEWCSPGYWRQEHHLGSWEATFLHPDMPFSAIFGYAPKLSKLGERRGATDDPTLWQVLQSPQYYGGDAFNLVADLLSDIHPGVNFLGERVEDSCPLGRAQPGSGAPPRVAAAPGHSVFLPLIVQ